MIFSAVVTLVAVLSAATADILPPQVPQHGHRVVCFVGTVFEHYTYTSLEQTFNMSDVEPALHLCTHLIYSCAGMEDLDVKLFNSDDYNSLNNIQQLVSMKTRKFPNLKIMISITSLWTDRTAYSNMAESPTNRTKFVENTLNFVLKNGLDGMDIGWVFTSTEPDFAIKNYHQILLTKELRQEFDKHGLIVSVTILMVLDALELNVDIAGLSEHVHFVNLGTSAHQGFDKIVFRHMRFGVPPEKINFGLFSMGYFYKIENSDSLKNKTKLVNNIGPVGLMRYNVLCKEIEKGGWNEEVDFNVGAAYFDDGVSLAILDNPTTTFLKISYAMNGTLGGVAYDSLDADDFRGECAASGGKYPMLRDIDRRMVQLSSLAYKDIFDIMEQNYANYFWNGMIDV